VFFFQSKRKTLPVWNTLLCVKCGIFKSYLLFDFSFRWWTKFLFSGKLSLSTL